MFHRTIRSELLSEVSPDAGAPEAERERQIAIVATASTRVVGVLTQRGSAKWV